LIRISDKEFHLLSDYIKKNYGIYLKTQKKVLVEGRLNALLEQLGFHSYMEYYHYLISDKSGKAVSALLDRITTNHTYFMREREHFIFFRDKVLPYVMENIKDHDLRVWCCACSTGEEPYTLAMIIDEFFGKEKFFWDTTILATDISKHVLEIASNGIYSKDKIDPLPFNWKMNYFTQIDVDHYMVVNQIRKEVIFRKYNLMEKPFPLKKQVHIIFCRNVMIYFSDEDKKELIERFYDSLVVGGLLFLGHSETIDKNNKKFRYLIPSVFQKI
jgi:chemotaxis protein methyltransferase CheR